VLQTEAGMEVHAEHTAEQPTMNIVGLLEGGDGSRGKEYLVIGAHLDHVGSQGNVIYAPGANDNASGSAAVLQMARAFISSGAKPKRPIIFVLFASEEIGLAGASHFVDHPPIPLENITAMLNLDCIGFGDSIQVGNGKSSPRLWDIARRLDSASTKMMVERTWNGGGADAGPFHGKGIPALYFVSTNSYKHLHYITDTPETLNPPLFEAITRLAYITAYNIAGGEYERETVKP
jgi:Zn-dependent M28 family amino/carboxypeptidase